MRRTLSILSALTLVACFTLTASAEFVTVNYNDFTILSGGKLTINENVTVTGLIGSEKDIEIRKNCQLTGDIYSYDKVRTGDGTAIIGSLFSSKDITLTGTTLSSNVNSLKGISIEDNSVVNGNVSYGNKYKLSKDSSVFGSVTKDSVADWSFTMPTAPDISTSVSKSVDYKKKSSTTLTDGDYGDLTFKEECSVYLTAGVYNFNSLELGRDVSFFADTSEGDVIINIVGDFIAGDNSKVDNGQSNRVVFNALGSIELGKDIVADASFNSFSSSMSIDKNSEINGTLYADQALSLGEGVSVNGVTGTSPGSVPEPATCILLIMSLAMMGRKGLKNKKL